MITDDDILKANELFRWIHPRVNGNAKIWKVGDPLDTHCVYQYQENKKTIAIWMDVPILSETHFKRIYKKHNILSHEFFLTHKSGVYRFGWRIKKKQKL